MAGTFVATGSFYNLTRLQLEQIRKADYYSGGTALTLGDGGDVVGGVGVGALVNEDYFTNPTLLIDDTYAIPPMGNPGEGLGSLVGTAFSTGETTTYYGPSTISGSATGYALNATQWFDTAAAFVTDGINPGDVVCILAPSGVSGDTNNNVTGVVLTVTTNTLTLHNIVNPNTSGTTLSNGASTQFNYLILRPGAIQLFAVPGSGPLGQEQTYMVVSPTSSLHTTLNPTVAQIDADRLTNLIPPRFVTNPTTQDRADSIFFSGSLDTLGYRMVLYPDHGTGINQGTPNLAAPIASPNPTIDPTKTDPSSGSQDTRLTIDYKSGIVRLSTPPTTAGNIKVTGGVSGVTGRMNLYAVFFRIAPNNFALGAARQLVALRTTPGGLTIKKEGRIFFDPTYNAWHAGTTQSGNDFVVQAIDVSEDVELATRFGAFQSSAASPFRGFYWTQNGNAFGKTMGLITHDPWIAGDGPPIVAVADKTSVTVGDITTPPLNPGADYNAQVTYGTTTGARDAFGGLQLAVSSIVSFAGSQLRTIHLHQGRYYAYQEIVVPPNTIIEGEGEATKIIQREINGFGGLSTIFKFGPNTPYGTYDYGAATSSLLDQQTPVPIASTTLSTSSVVEGMSCVWNPVRRVWAYVYADLNTNAIIFQEVNSAGVKLFAGIGVQVNTDLKILFSSLSPRSSNHTPCHYPRIVYHEHTDTYVVVWVEQQTVGGIGIGPKVVIKQFEIIQATVTVPTPSLSPLLTSSMPLTYNNYYAFGGTNTSRGTVTGTFFDHPSVCVDTSDPSSTYAIWVSAWTYSMTAGGQIDTTQFSGAVRAQLQPSAVVGPGAFAGYDSGGDYVYVVSSTDIKDDGQGGYFSAMTSRSGIPLFSTTGTISVSSGVGTLTDTGLPAGTNFGNFVVPFNAAKFIYLYNGVTNTGTGRAGYVTNTSTITTSLSLAPEDNPSLGTTWVNATGNLSYAIIPRGAINAYRYTGVSNTETMNYISSGTPSFVGNYITDQVEPDFVRVCQGDENWLVAYQAMNTTGFLSQTALENFASGLNATTYANYYLSTNMAMQSYELFREHISTCALILNDSLNIVYPYEPGGSSPSAFVSRDIQVSNRSLGARDPVTFRPNFYDQSNLQGGGVRSGRSKDREISAMNFFHRWNPALGIVPSLIPDVAWTGSDWIVVSPSQDQVHSKIGSYTVDGSGIAYLSDPSYYFGAEGLGVHFNGTSWVSDDGSWLKQTIVPGQDSIYFPSISATVGITHIFGEHTIVLASNPFGTGSPSNIAAVEWVLLRSSSYNTAGVKTPGFRVAPDGRKIVSTDFITMVDAAPDLEVGQGVVGSRVQTLRRPGTDGHNLPGTSAKDNIDPDARMLATLAYRGICVGAPKATSTALGSTVGLAATEQPMVALAWNDSGYGFIQRSVNDVAQFSSALNFFYQSFGPYNSGLRDLQITTANKRSEVTATVTGSTNLQLLSSKKVFSRTPTFGNVNVNGDFATDGYRNVFATTGSGASNIHGVSSGNFNNADHLALMAYYTDAIGENAIRKQGPQPFQAGVIYPNEFAEASVVSPTPAGPFAWGTPAFCPNLAGTPKVIWDGQRFIAVWLEQQGFNTAPYGSASGVGAYLCVGVFPGDEDAGYQSPELVDPNLGNGNTYGDGIVIQSNLQFFVNQWPSEIVRVSVGSVGVQTFQCDVATSGKTVAVLWTGGLDPLGSGSSSSPDTAASGGSAVGVALFDLTSFNSNAASQYNDGPFPPGAGTSYGIDSNGQQGSNGFAHPKITWDGKQFVAMWVNGYNADNPGNVNQLAYLIVPEHGLSRAPQYKTFGALNPNNNTMGVGNGVGSLILDPFCPVLPGDTIVLTSGTITGTFYIVDYNPSTHAVYVSTTSNFGTGSSNYTGFVFGASSVGGQEITNGFSTNQPTNYGYFVGNGTTTGDYSQLTNTANNISRLCGLVYNEVQDEYVAMYLAGSEGGFANMYVANWKRSGTTPYGGGALTINGSSPTARAASIAWNGRNYLITYVSYIAANADPSNESLNYILLSPTLQVVESGAIINNNNPVATTLSSTTLMGNGAGQVPGTFYQLGSSTSYISNAHVLPRLRNTKAVWNNRLNRWVVSCSLFWNDNISSAVSIGGYSNAPQQFQARSGTTNGSYTYSGNIITISGSFPVQPGTRIFFVLNSTKTQSAYVTVVSIAIGANTQITVDTSASEVGSPTSGSYTMELALREDVFCFTLGTSVPAVKIHDADGVFLENITFGGSGADIEEKYTQMARPIWQNGGSSAGQIPSSVAYSTFRAGQYNHAFLTPTMKVNMPRYTNVKSTTRMRFGYGLPPGMPVNRYLFDGLNRRG
jgi:hypothetical protein